MGIEIERKFLAPNFRPDGLTGNRMKQFYIGETDQSVTRVRIDDQGAKVTIKSKGMSLERREYEYDLPIPDAEQLLKNALGRPIYKSRYKVKFLGTLWEIDIFEGDDKGLILAEVELNDVNQPYDKPDYIGDEVTSQKEYYNYYMALHKLS